MIKKLILKTLLLLVLIVVSFSCNKNFYKSISAENFLVDNWYVFDDFRYQGSLINGLPNGFGKVEYKNGLKATGRFTNGVLNDSTSTFNIPNVGNISGIVKDGNLIYGKIHYSNGDVYVGAIKSFKPNGNGIFLNQRDQVFEGLFSSGSIVEGKYFDALSGSTFIGKFKSWQLDGEVVEINSSGKAIGHVFSSGINNTLKVIENESIKRVEAQNVAELNKYGEEVESILKKKKEDIQIVEDEKRKLEEEKSEIYNICACRVLDGCLEGYSSNYSRFSYREYYQELNLPDPFEEGTPKYLSDIDVYLPSQSSPSVIKAALLNESEIMAECHEWKKDRENYEITRKGKINTLDTKKEQILLAAENDISSVKLNREQAIQRQQVERENDILKEKQKLEAELSNRAKKEKEKRDNFCNKFPNCCLSTSTIEQLRSTNNYTPCATKQ